MTREAVAAVRTLTLNLTRLSRVGIGSASRRADFLRLAQLFAAAPDDTPRLAAAAFGLMATNHYGVIAADAGDPVPTATSWWDAPRAEVAISIRERGDTTPRGRISPLPDRTRERELLRRRRELERVARDRVDHELLDEPVVDGRSYRMVLLRVSKKWSGERSPSSALARSLASASMGSSYAALNARRDGIHAFVRRTVC